MIELGIPVQTTLNMLGMEINKSNYFLILLQTSSKRESFLDIRPEQSRY